MKLPFEFAQHSVTAVSLCVTDLSCFSLQCVAPSGCCERLVLMVEGMTEGTSVRTRGRVKLRFPLVF